MSTSPKAKFRFIDLFAGLGGFHQAASRLGGECVFASEIDENLREIYSQNFGMTPSGDIREVKVAEVPDHELLCAGFPCQPFSKAGEQMGWNDPVRGTVFWNIVQILREKHPPIVLLENVAHFVRHDQGNTYEKVKAALENEGYSVDVRQFSPHQFGVPQIRERVYMVGVLRSLGTYQWPTPETTAAEVSIKSVLDINPTEATSISQRVTDCLNVWQQFLELFSKDEKLPSFPIWSMEFGATYPVEYDALCRVPLDLLRKSKGSFGVSLARKERSEIYDLVPSHAVGSRRVFPQWKQDFILQNRSFFDLHRKKIEPWLPKIREFPSSLQKLEWNCQGEERNIWNYLIQFRASGVRIKRANTSPSLVAMTTTQVPIVGWERRYMTPRECARLQSMEKLKVLPAGGAAMKALGNAVNVNVVTKILGSLLPLIRNSDFVSSRNSLGSDFEPAIRVRR